MEAEQESGSPAPGESPGTQCCLPLALIHHWTGSQKSQADEILQDLFSCNGTGMLASLMASEIIKPGRTI